MIKSARDAAAFRNKLDVEAQDVALKKMISEGVMVNEVKDLNEFKATLEAFKAKYVKEKGPAWVDLFVKITNVK